MSAVREPRAAADEAAVELITTFNAAWADHDLAAAMALISDDCLFESTSPPDGERHVGHAAIRAAWQPIFAATDSKFTVEETFASGSRVVQRWRYDWADGHIRGVDVFAVAAGKITQKLAYVKG